MKTKLLLFTIFLITISTFAQPFQHRHQRGPRERLEQLEKIKLLEVMDLGEEQSIRFFARRDDFKDSQREILDKRDSLMREAEDAIRDNKENFNYALIVDKLLQIEQQLIENRKSFIKSLNDILTEKQIASFVVFESKFMNEVREALMKRRGGQ